MDDKTKGYLEGLQAAALICQENAGDRNSHLSDKIMSLHNKITLENEMVDKMPYAEYVKIREDKLDPRNKILDRCGY